MIRLSQLVGQRVLARDGGQLVGSLRRLMIDADVSAVAAAHVERPAGVAGSIVDWAAVAGIGPEGVVVERADALREPRDIREWQLLQGRFDVSGKLVLNEQGNALGKLEDFEFDPASGRLARLFVPGHVVEVERLVAFGPDALIVPSS